MIIYLFLLVSVGHMKFRFFGDRCRLLLCVNTLLVALSRAEKLWIRRKGILFFTIGKIVKQAVSIVHWELSEWTLFLQANCIRKLHLKKVYKRLLRGNNEQNSRDSKRWENLGFDRWNCWFDWSVRCQWCHWTSFGWAEKNLLYWKLKSSKKSIMQQFLAFSMIHWNCLEKISTRIMFLFPRRRGFRLKPN